MRMNRLGRISDWNDDRGFGFVEPNDGGSTLFFHISALSGKHARRPVIGDTVSFDILRAQDGRLRAINVRVAGACIVEKAERRYVPKRASVLARLAVLVLMSLGAYLWLSGSLSFLLPGKTTYEPREQHFATESDSRPVAVRPVVSPFSCDGRRYCSQMRSREEAVFFVRNCPGTEMDGDGDGVPCERDSRW
jgi:cold shock CspA family protein